MIWVSRISARIMRTVGVFIAILMSGVIPCAATTFSDGTFSTLDWDNDIGIFDDPQVAGSNPGTSTAGISRQLSGGTPSAFRQSIHNIVRGDVVYTEGLNTAALYDPARQGAIDSIDFEADLRHPNAGATAWQLLIEQNDTKYYSVPLGAFEQNTDWQEFSQLNLTEADFDTNPLSGFFGELPDGNAPDFSLDGSEMTFGYALGNTLPSGTFFSNTVGIDNWHVEIDIVPWTGDFDRDGDVDGYDFLVWQRDIGSAEALAAWKDNFGDTGLATLQAVPEPTATVLALVGCGCSTLLLRSFRGSARGKPYNCYDLTR